MLARKIFTSRVLIEHLILFTALQEERGSWVADFKGENVSIL